MKNRCISASFAKIIGIISQLVVTALVSRRLSGEAFGIWVICAHAMFMAGLFDGGLGGGALRNALTQSPSKDEQTTLFFSTFYLMMGIYLVLALIYMGFIEPYLHRMFVVTDAVLLGQLKIIGRIFVTSMMIKIPFSIYGNSFCAFQEDSHKALIDSMEAIFLMSATLSIVYFQGGFVAVYAGYYTALCGVSVWGFIRFLRKRKWIWRVISWKDMQRSVQPLFKIHRAFWIQNILSLLLFSFSPYLLMRCVNLEQVGEYTLIYRGCCLFIGIHFAALNPLWSFYTKAFDEKKWDWVEKKFLQALKWTLVVFVGGSLSMIFFYPTIFKIWVGKRLMCTEIVILYTLWMTLYAVINCFSVLLNALNRLGKQSLSLFIGAISNLVLGTIFGKAWGVHGVILASIFSLCPLFFSNLIEVLQLKKRVGSGSDSYH